MTNMLLRHVRQFGHYYVKVVIHNNDTKILNSKIKGSNKMINNLARNVSTEIEMVESINQEKTVAAEMNIVSRYIKRYNRLYKKQIGSIIGRIHSSDSISNTQIYLLFQWCNMVPNCLPFERVELGESLWSILNICNFEMCVGYYNALLKLYISNEHYFSPTNVLKDMESKGIHPDEVTYEICIKYCCQRGNINEALMLVESMKKLRFPITECVFNSLIMGYSHLGDLKTVNKTLCIMKQGKMKLTAKTYVAVMCTYAKFNRIDKITEIINMCNLNNIHFTNKDILNVIYTLAVNNHAKYIHIMYKYLQKRIDISNSEIQIMLKLTRMNATQVAVRALTHICLNSKDAQFKNILKLMLKYAIDKSKLVHEIIRLCTVFQNEQLFKNSLLMSLNYSLLKCSNLCLPLLKICKHYCTLKPHFFWPLLIQEANKYDLEGILDILKTMVNDFNVSPCVDTIADYVLPITFGSCTYVRRLLMNYQISTTIIDNAYISYMLKKKKLKDAALYIQLFKGKYFYKIIAHDLRYASVYKNDIHNFLYISSNLVEQVDLFSSSESIHKSNKEMHMCIDQQLCDFMLDFPSHKTWLKRVIKQLVYEDVRIKYKTACMITDFLNETVTSDLLNELELLANKEV